MNIYFVSLGCPRNLVDTETMLGQVLEAGHRVCADLSAADCVVVNTCAFVRPAIDESIDTILEMGRWKEHNQGRRLIVTGCLPQRYGQSLAESLPEVDVFLGTGAFDQIERFVGVSGIGEKRVFLPPIEKTSRSARELPRLQTTAPHTAYLKIAEGCSSHCTYCVIPELRGPQRSRPMKAILSEAEWLVHGGAKELILVAQNTTAYGQDLPQGEDRIHTLLDRLAQIPGLIWIRLLYGHPGFVTEPLVESMVAHPNVCPYLDIPFQHASKRILKRMGRPCDPAYNLALVKRLRDKIPGVALRTTVITGFPGETDADFETLVTFVEEVRFDHMGVFMYSDDTDLPSNKLPGHVDDQVKQTRFDYLMERQARISRENNQQYVGKTVRVLVEEPVPNNRPVVAGRMATQAPGIDGMVFIENGTAPAAGTFVNVCITEAHDYDLTGYIP